VPSAEERAAMRRALALAAGVAGSTSPNPPVGAVILDAAGEVVGEGATRPAGQAHAEVVALAAAGRRARGGMAVLTLEPCAHTGRTPPCVQALLASGVARVVYAVDDPNPVAAGGAGLLRARGIDVVAGLLATEAARGALEPWLFAVRHRRPYVTWKLAATLDGRVAAADGTSRWITGAAARADVHRLRSTVDAIAVGVGTVLADDPRLTVRTPDGTAADRQPLRVVLDAQARTPATARVLDGTAPTLLAVTDPVAAASLPAAVLALPAAAGAGAGGVDVPALLRALYDRGVRHLLLEGGPTVAGAFVAAGCVDRVVAYVAPALLGAGPAALGPAGIGTIGAALRLRVDDVALVGEDVRITARPRREGEGREEDDRKGEG
jgi:diaminohydroxyphosphoribosylaminopyrimidine deaminase / 5-amino-6-(5-phosphoribosylamino)uracil reductase